MAPQAPPAGDPSRSSPPDPQLQAEAKLIWHNLTEPPYNFGFAANFTADLYEIAFETPVAAGAFSLGTLINSDRWGHSTRAAGLSAQHHCLRTAYLGRPPRQGRWGGGSGREHAFPAGLRQLDEGQVLQLDHHQQPL